MRVLKKNLRWLLLVTFTYIVGGVFYEVGLEDLRKYKRDTAIHALLLTTLIWLCWHQRPWKKSSKG